VDYQDLHSLTYEQRLQLRLDLVTRSTGETAPSPSYHHLGDPIHALQCPLDSFIARQPFLTLHRRLSLGPTSFEQSLFQAKDVRGELRPYALLGSKTGYGDHASEHSADLVMTLGKGLDGVREEGSVVRGQDVDGEVRVGLSEFGEEFGRVGFVDPIP
jgi:hypothetical protein